MAKEITYSLKYALLTSEAYTTLNDAISTAKGYTTESSTRRYAPVEPQMSAPVLDPETEEVITPSMCVMPITAEVQEHYNTIIANIELVDNYTPLLIED